MKPEEIQKILTYDGLDDAEKMTGASYKESKFTEAIGVMNCLENNAKREAAMLATDDTPFSCTVENYLRISGRIGFKVALELPFKGHGWSDDQKTDEKLYILWRDGILLKFDTFGGDKLNGGTFWYNWKPNTREDCRWPSTSSGGMNKDGIWAGNHDCREALVFHVSQLEQHGSFLSRWVERPFLWLLHYMDTKDASGKDLGYGNYNADEINAKRIAMLPEEVRKAISPIHSTKK